MKIFIVRHGETLLNKQKVHQAADTPLSEIGLEQANKIGRRVQYIKIDKIYVSPLLRAYQTAEAIAKKANVSLEIRKELEEIRRPSAIVGRPHSDPEVIAIKEQILGNISTLDWHYSDEENYSDIKARIAQLLNTIIEDEMDNTVLLVTHRYIAKMIGAYAVMGKLLTPDLFLSFYNHSELSNTGLSAIEYTKEKGFKLLFWNDISHY